MNTDMDLSAPTALEVLVLGLERQGMISLHLGRDPEGLWHARLETGEQHIEPEPNISAMLDAVEALPEPARYAWGSCTRRTFSIGYDCGGEPGALDHGLSSELIGRLAAHRIGLGITLYAIQGDADAPTRSLERGS